jgi:cell division septal protein FtsQ
MIIEYIERLRKEPKEVRQRAVFFWTAVLVAVIVLLYIVYLVFSSSWFTPSVPDSESIASPYGSR